MLGVVMQHLPIPIFTRILENQSGWIITSHSDKLHWLNLVSWMCINGWTFMDGTFDWLP